MAIKDNYTYIYKQFKAYNAFSEKYTHCIDSLY